MGTRMHASGRVRSLWLVSSLFVLGCGGLGGMGVGPKAPEPVSPEPGAADELKEVVTGVAPTSVVLDDQYAYFTNSEVALEARLLLRVPLAGGPAEALATGRSTWSMSLARVGTKLYWLEGGSPPAGGLFGLETTGGTPGLVFASVSDVPVPNGVDVGEGKPGAGIVFANAYRSQLFQFEGGVTTVAPKPLLPDTNPDTHLFYYPFSVTSAGADVYFLSDGGMLFRVPRAGGKPVVIADKAEKSPLTTDGAALYYEKQGAIVRLPTAGGTESVFAAAAGTVSDMKRDGGNLYWTCSSCGTVMRQALDGTTATTLASGLDSPRCLAVGAERVYFGTAHALYSVKK
jgi:hypothetical protein